MAPCRALSCRLVSLQGRGAYPLSTALRAALKGRWEWGLAVFRQESRVGRLGAGEDCADASGWGLRNVPYGSWSAVVPRILRRLSCEKIVTAGGFAANGAHAARLPRPLTVGNIPTRGDSF